jgi:hypothetical protein
MVFSLAYKDLAAAKASGISIGDGEDPMENIAATMIRDSNTLKDLLEQVGSLAIVWCESSEPTCDDSSFHSYIDSVERIAKEVGYSINDEIRAARASSAASLISRIH